jgi:hypothetical protein
MCETGGLDGLGAAFAGADLDGILDSDTANRL